MKTTKTKRDKLASVKANISLVYGLKTSYASSTGRTASWCVKKQDREAVLAMTEEQIKAYLHAPYDPKVLEEKFAKIAKGYLAGLKAGIRQAIKQEIANEKYRQQQAKAQEKQQARKLDVAILNELLPEPAKDELFRLYPNIKNDFSANKPAV